VRRVLAHDIGLDVVERSLHSQIVFGSGSPRVTTKRVAAGIRQLGLSPSVFERVASTNALALLGAERIAA
jgi:predicted TIM-barrel fold metal-dependent hydrolase